MDADANDIPKLSNRLSTGLWSCLVSPVSTCKRQKESWTRPQFNISIKILLVANLLKCLRKRTNISTSLVLRMSLSG